jgi:hypothetical protein
MGKYNIKDAFNTAYNYDTTINMLSLVHTMSGAYALEYIIRYSYYEKHSYSTDTNLITFKKLLFHLSYDNIIDLEKRSIHF